MPNFALAFVLPVTNTSLQYADQLLHSFIRLEVLEEGLFTHEWSLASVAVPDDLLYAAANEDLMCLDFQLDYRQLLPLAKLPKCLGVVDDTLSEVVLDHNCRLFGDAEPTQGKVIEDVSDCHFLGQEVEVLIGRLLHGQFASVLAVE